MLERVFSVVSHNKQDSRHHIGLFRSLNQEITFFGYKGLEPLYVVLLCSFLLFVGWSIWKVFGVFLLISGILYYLRNHTKPYLKYKLNAVLTYFLFNRSQFPKRDSVFIKKGGNN